MEEPTPRTTLFDLPNDTLCKIAHVSNVSSLASLMCTSSLYKQALLTNDAIWASKLPSHVAVHQYKNAHAALKHWTIATQRLGTSNPHAQWTAPCEKLWPPCDVVILPPPHKEDHPSARPPAILTASCAGTLFFPNATDLSRRYDLPGGRMDHGIQPLLGLHDGRMYLATSHRETIRCDGVGRSRMVGHHHMYSYEILYTPQHDQCSTMSTIPSKKHHPHPTGCGTCHQHDFHQPHP